MFKNLIVSEINFSDIALLKQFKEQIGEQPTEIIKYEEFLRAPMPQSKRYFVSSVDPNNMSPVKIFFKLQDVIKDKNVRITSVSTQKIENVLVLEDNDYKTLVNDVELLLRVYEALDTAKLNTLLKTLWESNENQKGVIARFIKKLLVYMDLDYEYKLSNFLKNLLYCVYSTPEYLNDIIEDNEIFAHLTMNDIYCTGKDAKLKSAINAIQIDKTIKYLVEAFLNEKNDNRKILEDVNKIYNIICYLNNEEYDGKQTVSLSEKETNVFVKNFFKHISNLKTDGIRLTKKRIKYEGMVLISQMNKNGILNILDNSQSLKAILKWIQSDDLDMQISLNRIVINMPILYKYIDKYLLYIETILECGRLYADTYYEKVSRLAQSPLIKFDKENCRTQLKKYCWEINSSNLIKAIKNIKETETNAINSLIRILSSNIKVHDLDDIKVIEKYC